MTFMHKLSRRLAQAHEALGLVLPLAVLIACELPTVAANPNAVTQLLVVPESLTAVPGQQIGFHAHGRTAVGDSVALPVTWVATAGNVDQGGTFTAPTATGDVSVTATSPTLNLSASSRIHVRLQGVVVVVSMTPATASIGMGRTVQLTATPKDAGGNPLTGRVVTWATSNAAVATVNGTGLVTAVATGSATITATSEGKSGTSAVTVSAVPVASVTVSPASASLVVAQTVQLTATPKDASGNPLTGRVITWTNNSTTVATVSGTGLVTGKAAGAATITATSEGQNGTSAITVALAPVASVTVSPASLSLNVGQTGQLTATLKDANGNILTGRAITWSSNSSGVVMVNASGLVSALAVGAAVITASSEGRSGTAGVTVTAASGGGAVLVQENFEDNAFASRGWYDNTSLAITDSEHIAGSTHALEAHFPLGATTPTWGGSMRHLFTATPTLYVSYWVKYSDNWVGSGQAYHPHEFTVLSDLDGDYDGPSVNYLTVYLEENYQNGGIPRMAMQDNKSINTSYGTPPINLVGVTENRSTSGCNGVVESNVVTSCYNAPPWYNGKEIHASQVWFQPTPGPGYKGNWNHVEAYYQINSIVNGVGQPDGVMQYWFNGTLAIDRHDILYRTAAHPSINFHQFLIAPYIGNGSPVDQYMWVDNLTVATNKP